MQFICWKLVGFGIGKVALDACDAKASVAVLADDDFHKVGWLVPIMLVRSVNKANLVSIKLQLPRFPKVGHYRPMVAPSLGCTG